VRVGRVEEVGERVHQTAVEMRQIGGVNRVPAQVLKDSTMQNLKTKIYKKIKTEITN
jgi:hypothetical protein